MKHIHINREGDGDLYKRFYDRFKADSDQELIEAYQQQLKTGITGVHAQAVYLLALRAVMKERFGKSPITLDDGNVIDLY